MSSTSGGYAPSGRAVRNAVAALLIAGLFAGTFWWQVDDAWPLAQMRMFPGGGESAISIVRIDAELRNGKHRDMNPFDFHLKRAEIEGQMNRIRLLPSMLGDLMDTYNQTVPRDREIVSIRLIRHVTPKGGGRTDKRVLVEWPPAA
jgi:hypothetical protein